MLRRPAVVAFLDSQCSGRSPQEQVELEEVGRAERLTQLVRGTFERIERCHRETEPVHSAHRELVSDRELARMKTITSPVAMFDPKPLIATSWSVFWAAERPS
jgi:hypothetical protein